MKNIQTFEKFEYIEDINEGLFDSDFKTAMTKWKAAFGYYYENGKGQVFMKTLINGLQDNFKSNKKFLGTIINTFDHVKKVSAVGADSSGVGGNKITKKMPKLEDVAKNYNSNPEYYDSKALELIKKNGIEVTEDIRKILYLKKAQAQTIQENVQSFKDFN